MTVAQIECFVEAAKEGNISKAAEKLFITQQTASSQLKALEKELDLKLFERKNKGISLTKEGEMLYEEWLDIRDRLRVSIDKVKDYHLGKSEHIRIGLEDMGNCSEDIMQSFSEYEKKYEDLYIDFEMMTPKQMLTQFEKNNLDMAILYQSEFEDFPAFKYLPLHKRMLKVCVFLSKNHPLAAKEQVSLADLSNETIGLLNANCSLDFEKTLKNYFISQGVKLPERYKEYSSRRDLEIALIAGRCVTIVYETMFHNEENKLLSKELAGKDMFSRIALFWKNEEMDIKAHALYDILQSKLSQYN